MIQSAKEKCHRRPKIVALGFPREKKRQRRKQQGRQAMVKKAQPKFDVSGIISVDKLMTYLSRKITAKNPASPANPASMAISRIEINRYESQIRNCIITTNATAAIVDAIAIVKQTTNHQCAFSRRVSRCLMCSMWPSVVNISNIREGTYTFRRSLFMPAGKSLSRKNIACASIYRKKFVSRYPFGGSVRIYEDSNIFIFLVFKEIVLKEKLLVEIESFILIMLK